ncbi:2-aminoethylphosphonate--pyruvate transaminase [uncultured Aquitalea sp.]|uniref:2-aminoethylphosphonate--pyruvate transaminase n=1 Tax=uncultured Aquitalea sp. TaxID=540272 RepID=UPI0025E126E6|nr:2-aminoethylphosphonate--pyruvate transaminase [uncultured Aquitalea sp.]
MSLIPDAKTQDYLLLTPGPLSTTRSVRAAMLYDSCTWDDDYNLGVVEPVRAELVRLAAPNGGGDNYTVALLQGSGSYVVESVLGSALAGRDKLLIVNNGAYGSRMVEIARVLGLHYVEMDCGETSAPNLAAMARLLESDAGISHVAMVHCETTTGMLNPLEEVAALCRRHGRELIVDAMSSFGGVPMDVPALGASFVISSANKCIQGVPGFGFVIARRDAMARCQGRARSLALDLYAQWHAMETQHGKWRFTSPTHTVLAFAQALRELDAEGGVAARYQRYRQNQRKLVNGMRELGFDTLLPDAQHSPVITAFHSPSHPDYQFKRFYQLLKDKRFVIYPGKVSRADCFRIGNIGDVSPADVDRLLTAIAASRYWLRD